MQQRTGKKTKVVRLTPVLFTIPGIFKGQLRYLAENGFEVHLITSPAPDASEVCAEEQCIHHPVEITRRISPIKDFLAILRVYGILKKIRPAILHTHTTKGGLIGIIAGRLAGVPCCVHFMPGFSAYAMSPIKRRLVLACERITYRLAHRLVPNSFSLKEFLSQSRLVIDEKVDIIGFGSSNGVSLERFSRTTATLDAAKTYRDKFSIKESDTVFIFVGRLSVEKGIVELVQAFTGIQDKNIHLMFLGRMESNRALLPENISKIIHEHPRIHLTGWTDDVPGFLACADILVLPTYHEGFPNALLQGAAMGLPIIATDVRGCRDIIQHMETGLLVPPENPAALQNAMSQMLKSTDLRKTLSTNNLENVRKKWAQEKVCMDLQQYYNKLIEGTSGNS